MSCNFPRILILAVLCLFAAGCQPHRPAYRFDQGDSLYYVGESTEIAYPDVETPILDEVTQAHAPITNSNSNFESFWDLTLEDAVAIGLQNSKVIRGYGTPGLQGTRVAAGVDNLANGPQGAGSIYRVGIRETEPGFIGQPGQLPSPSQINTNTGLDANQGVEAALADFDAQLTSAMTWGRSDQPRNVTGFGLTFTPDVFQQDLVNWSTQVAKKTAGGTQLLARTVNSYTANTIPDDVQPLESVFQTALEFEIRQPLLRGRGEFINRMPVVISRINTDQQIANFESTMQNMVTNIEIRYWDLHCAYRNVETAKAGRDGALDTWRTLSETYKEGRASLQDEAQARGQYFFFRGQVEQAWADLLIAEGNLRYLLGVAATDGRLIRAIDEPTKARLHFDWCQTMDEALAYRPELRQQRWEIKKRELALAYSKNALLPSLDVSALYRWLGLGDRWVNYDANTPQFPQNGSGALNELYDGNYQEMQFSLDFGLPVGFRRELSNVRNAQLKMAEDLARQEDMELDVSREVTQALQALDHQYQLAQTSFNSWAAYTEELEGRRRRFLAGTDPITFLLDAQRSRAQGENQYYQAICEYNKLIALIHRRKGTILGYNSIFLGEGAWPEKAYSDASENARKRGASREVNYGFTRPEVISAGPIYPPAGDSGAGIMDSGLPGGIHDDSYLSQPEAFDLSIPPADLQPVPYEEIPAGEPIPTPANQNERTEKTPDQSLPNPGEGSSRKDRSGTSPITQVPAPAQGGTEVPSVDWRRFGFTSPTGPGRSSQAAIRQVNHEEPVEDK